MMEQGGLMPPTVAPTVTRKTQPELAETQVISTAQAVSSTGPTDVTVNGTFVMTEWIQNTTTKTGRETPVPGSTTTVQRTTYPLTRVYTSRSSTRTPGFHRLVKVGGILPVNPFSHSTTSEQRNYRVEQYASYNNGFLKSTRHGVGPYQSWDEGIVDANWSSADLTTAQMNVLDREARLKVRLALKNMQVNVAQIVAERNKTASSIAKIVKTIAELILRLRVGDFVGAASAVGQHVGYRKRRQLDRTWRGNPTEAMSNAWLELQYAIKPLLMDVDGMCKALADHKYPKATGTAVATAIRQIDSVVMNGSRKEIKQGSVKVRYTVYFQIDYPEMPSFTALGLTNPALLAWELVPFSFVLDWLLPIGDWLSSLDATVGLRFSDGSMSVKKDISLTYQRRRVTETKGGYAWGEYSTRRETYDVSSSKVESITRTKLSSFPQVAFPPFKNPASLMHLATSMALLRKALSSTLRR